MTFLPTVLLRRLLLLLAVAALVPASATRLRASAEDHVDDAVSLSKNWVAQIDAGRYDESYTFTCEETRNLFTQERWVQVLKTIRSPWGAVVNRQQISHVYKPNGVDGLNGECEVITYNTTFKNFDNAMEVVVLKWQDGQWRGAGYNAGHVPSTADAAPAAPPVITETHTERNVRPPAQQ